MDGLGSASAHGALNRALDLLPTAEMDDNKALLGETNPRSSHPLEKIV